ncbi:MAG TPA: RNA polymerase sigma factor [Gaiellaceae bacterium]|nr:RNA polymerase sigma factor [Gaiellaceae bacterium]
MATAAPEIPVLARDLAFERLYRRYVQDVYHYALALLRNPADAEDVTQTTFLNAYRALKRGEVPLKPQNWLIKIAHNAARTRYARSTRRVREVPLDEHLDSLAVADDEKPDVHEVLHALGQLPLNQRAALVMRELEGRSYAEIAETIGVSVPAVETLIFRARRSLKLKASAVRVLGVVQLPPSLAQLFDGGGLLAGGGAAVGSGFLLKAAVALVAGAVATGVVGGEHSRRADATGVTGAIAAPPWDGVGAFARPNASKAGRTSQSFAAEGGAVAGPGIVSRRRFALEDGRATGGSATGGVDVGRTGDTSSASATPASTVDTVSSTISPVTQSIQPPQVPIPELPPTPQLPSVPSVPLPPPPPPPTLP